MSHIPSIKGQFAGSSALHGLCAPSPDYVKRDPEKSVLYQAIASHFNTFLVATEMESKHLPKHVIEEFEAFLRCGVLAYGFVRLRCEKCHHERIAALSCKKRGICSSCGGRRMAETAAHLVDHVFPHVGVRQWVISFPFQVRYLLARDPKIQSRCLEIVLRAISAIIKKKLRRQGATGQLQTGAVTIIQRAGGSINLNPHLHMLVLDGAYSHGEEGNPPRFHWLQSLTDDDVKALIKTIALRVVRHLKRHGHFRDDTQYVADEDTPPGDVMAELQAASVQSKIALGKKKGQKVKRLGSLGMIIDINPETKAPLCAAIEGFSLHAGVYCAPGERKKLEKIGRYIARPAVAEDRLRFDSRGDIMYKLKHPYTDGTSILVFSPLEFLEKIAALIPQPRIHLTRFHGCLAPHAKIRSLIVPKPETPKLAAVITTTAIAPDANKAKNNEKQKDRHKRMTWAELLARVFSIDMGCPNCGTELTPVAAIFETTSIVRILTHLGQPPKPPDISPANYPAAIAHCQA